MAFKQLSWHVMRRVFFAGLREQLLGVPTNEFRARNPKGNAILLHGWRESMDSPPFLELAFELREAGYNVLMFDMPNHGVNIENEKDRGHIQSFWTVIFLLRLFAYRVMLSRSRGRLPTYLIGYSMGALATVRLLQFNVLVREASGGAVFIAVPFRVSQNAGEKFQRYIPILRPARGIIKHVLRKRRIPDTERPEVPGDPKHYNGPANFCTAIEFYDAAEVAVAPGNLEKLAEMKNVAFFHGMEDDYAPFADAMKGYRRVVGESSFSVIEKVVGKTKTTYETRGGKFFFTAYEGVGHDIFAFADTLIPDIISRLDVWTNKKDFVPRFTEDRSDMLVDSWNFVWWSVLRLISIVWNLRHKVFALLRTLTRLNRKP